MNKGKPATWLLAALSCLTGHAQASATPADDEAQLRAVTAPGFHVFDVGKKMTGEELMAALKNAHASGKTYEWNVTEPRVRIEGAVAWLESAVLLKEGGIWRIQFFHSTRAAAG